MEKLKEYGHDVDYSARCIEANKHNSITTTYYLLLKKASKEGRNSKCDINSMTFDYEAVEPFKRAVYN